jgi:hypothetical protein
LWFRRSTSSQLPSGVTMRHEARLSSAVPHSTAFLPPAFIAMLPPMQEASAEVGSQAKTRPAFLRRFHDAARDQSGAGAHRRVVPVRTGQAPHLDGAEVDQLFGVDHRRQRIERHGAAGVAGAAAARDDGQAELDAGAHQRRHFLFGVRRSTTKGYSTRQSVASVTCETRARPSKQMLSRGCGGPGP